MIDSLPKLPWEPYRALRAIVRGHDYITRGSIYFLTGSEFGPACIIGHPDDILELRRVFTTQLGPPSDHELAAICCYHIDEANREKGRSLIIDNLDAHMQKPSRWFDIRTDIA